MLDFNTVSFELEYENYTQKIEVEIFAAAVVPMSTILQTSLNNTQMPDFWKAYEKDTTEAAQEHQE